LWTVHLMPFYALFVYSGPPRSHDDLGPTARWFVVRVMPQTPGYGGVALSSSDCHD
jgi:hypothetical protein